MEFSEGQESCRRPGTPGNVYKAQKDHNRQTLRLKKKKHSQLLVCSEVTPYRLDNGQALLNCNQLFHRMSLQNLISSNGSATI